MTMSIWVKRFGKSEYRTSYIGSRITMVYLQLRRWKRSHIIFILPVIDNFFKFSSALEHIHLILRVQILASTPPILRQAQSG